LNLTWRAFGAQYFATATQFLGLGFVVREAAREKERATPQ
jgi:hypothetical protein